MSMRRSAWLRWIALVCLVPGPAPRAAAQDDLTPPRPRGGAALVPSPPVVSRPAQPLDTVPPPAPSDEGGPAPTTAASAPGEETAAGLGTPQQGVARRPRPEPAEAEPWTGPRVELVYSHYVLVDGHGGGQVHAAVFGGYLPLSPLRLGISAEMGVRDYALGQDDALVRATLVAGYQYFGWLPVAPYVAALGSAGIVFGKRFRTPVSHWLGGGGLEVGADVNLVKSLFLGIGLAYLRVAMEGEGFDLYVLRLRVGL